MATHSSILPGEAHGQRNWRATVHGVTELDTAEETQHTHARKLNNMNESSEWFKVRKIILPKFQADINSFFLIFFKILYQLINNVVIFSGRQQRDSDIHTYVSILPETPFPSRLPHIMEQGFMGHTIGPCWLSILNIELCTFRLTSILSFSPLYNWMGSVHTMVKCIN